MGPYNKDYHIFGYISGSPHIGKLTNLASGPRVMTGYPGEAPLNWVAVEELNLSYYIGAPYCLSYIPTMVT